MASFKTVMKSGHPPTLFAAFLYFDFCFAIWVLNGAMGPFITETYKLTPAQTGFMISLPILAGAIMRFPLGVLAQYIGRKNAAITEMSLIILAMGFGFFYVSSFNDVLAMGVLLGIAGASFGVALSLGSGWFPAEHKGLAMGIAGAGNSGTVLAVLFAPPLAQAYGWQSVYGFAGAIMAIPLLVMIVFAKEPPDREHQSFREHIACLFEKDGWAFNLVYVITFGGFIGLSNFLPTFFYEQFAVTKVEAGRLTMLAALMGSAIRVLGGYFADRLGGILVLTVVLLAAVGSFLLLTTTPTLLLTTILFMFCFAALGAGNGALFQLVPLRWPSNTAVAGSMIGEIGALGGAILPNAMGLSKQYTGGFAVGFLFYAAFTAVVLGCLALWSRKWVGQWVGPRGKVLAPAGTAAAPASQGMLGGVQRA
ncbi:Nitrate transporter [Methylobacterium crusticola]|uniref:Nitrate transporter n=1 Tax=Methylobacterium crusticola TaxID=1697972 RepID=A0ABQ4QSB2_9HYPH|nr:MFS transporter [Methylobacterium crusticola]GJD48119.1 Nitrate transporter [Methylobacterium crusticola]